MNDDCYNDEVNFVQKNYKISTITQNFYKSICVMCVCGFRQNFENIEFVASITNQM